MGEVSEAARIEAHRARTDFRAMLERGALANRTAMHKARY
jgi:hypothetical protein